MAELDYSALDGLSEKGLLLYVTPAYLGIESVAIRGYANQNPQFPHESTGQQWFGESQFESYRALGFEIMENVLALAFLKASDLDLPKIFEKLWCDLSPRPTAT
jgi:hypothetical protein